MKLEEIKKIIVDWAIKCDISPNDFKWRDWFCGLVDPSLCFIIFMITNTSVTVEELEKLQLVTSAKHLSIIASKDWLEILVCYEAD